MGTEEGDSFIEVIAELHKGMLWGHEGGEIDLEACGSVQYRGGVGAVIRKKKKAWSL